MTGVSFISQTFVQFKQKLFTAPTGLDLWCEVHPRQLGNVLVEENSYWRQGFIFDALISHQYLQHLGSWTIDFDNMTYYFPG